MWTWQVIFYDEVTDRTFLVTCPRFFFTMEEAEADIVACCENGMFTRSGIPISARILTAEAIFKHGGDCYGQDD
jgi:hypothetical protein